MSALRHLSVAACAAALAAACAAVEGAGPEAAGGREGCRVVHRATQIEIHSPFLVFCLDAADGLRAQWWENRLTGKRISLGGGAELEVDVGTADAPLPIVQWRADRPPAGQPEPPGQVTFRLRAEKPPLSALVTYRTSAAEPVLQKTVVIENTGDRPLDRLLHVRLGSYRTGAGLSGGEQGFPLYLDGEFFMTLAHPAGWATARQQEVSLRQYPGARLAPGAKLTCMEAVYGVGKASEARKTFLAHLRGRTRRVVRGHDKPYAIFEPFGARPNGSFDETEAFVLDNIAKVAEGQRQTGCRFDLYSVDFWVDFRGDLKGFDPVRFPNGLKTIRAELERLGTAPGLWIDSSMTHWSIGGNPAVRPTFTHDPAKGDAPGVPVMCRATEPIRSMYTDAFRHHIRRSGVRLLKFDNLHSVCHNPRHEHLPGIYSTEAIQSAVIEFLHALDEECPDVFLMLYWGHRSPWWLLHADTLFDSGIGIEAASPSDFPAPQARDSITQRLDQAQWHAKDVPPLGKDSLGVWLSSWGWNSSVGKERWQEGFLMDLCRGHLLAQPWSDTAWLSPPERQQMADFIALLRARPGCFGNPRFVLGDPWKYGPYGYCCSDGKRAILAVNNCTWEDRSLELQLNPQWGLPDGRRWKLYRWYPRPAQLRGTADTFGREASISLRPFEVVLLEVVPDGEAPSLGRSFEVEPIPTGFAEASRPVDVSVDEVRPQPEEPSKSIWTVLHPTSCESAGGATLTRQKDGSILAGGKTASPDRYTIAADTGLSAITAVRLEVLPHESLPGKGPGRAVNGNFALTDLRVTAAPKGNPAAAAPVALHNPAADYSQQGYGGWPVAAAIDDDPKTGWSVDPQEGLAHAAVFEMKKPVGAPGGTTLTFALDQGLREHSIGCLRLSVTTAKPPIPPPKARGLKRLVVKGRAPASHRGGTLVVTLQMTRGGSPVALGNVGVHFAAEGKLAGQAASWGPVLGLATYPAPWQAWRIPLAPSPEPRDFELSIATKVGGNVALECKGHFIAKP